jgi:hypothetical protein
MQQRKNPTSFMSGSVKKVLDYIEKELDIAEISGVKIRYITDTEWFRIKKRFSKSTRSSSKSQHKDKNLPKGKSFSGTYE